MIVLSLIIDDLESSMIIDDHKYLLVGDGREILSPISNDHRWSTLIKSSTIIDDKVNDDQRW